jgi:hypothetical protein
MDVTFRPMRKKERQELQGYVSPGIAVFRALAFGPPSESLDESCAACMG